MRIVTYLALLFSLLLAIQPGLHADEIIDNRTVNTSIAFGTFTPPPGYGLPQKLVFAGTLISDGLFELIAADTNDPILPDAFDAQLQSGYATLDNLTFLISDLVQFGPAGDQLAAAYQQLLDQLEAANPGVTFLAPNPAGAVTYRGTKSYDLFGGTIPDTPNPGDTTSVTGTANVDFFSGDFTVTATVADTDGDGVPDDEDACPNSDRRPRVWIADCNSHVVNRLYLSGEYRGCTLADLVQGIVAECAVEARSFAEFQACVSLKLLPLMFHRVISPFEYSRLVACAALAYRNVWFGHG